MRLEDFLKLNNEDKARVCQWILNGTEKIEKGGNTDD